jgi:hypothetical protein
VLNTAHEILFIKKSQKSAYSDLDFPGVEVRGLSVQTAGQPINQLFTYRDTNDVQLLGIDFK